MDNNGVVTMKEKPSTSTNPRKKRTKFLRVGGSSKPTTTSRPAITHPCTECGKKFWSWKALYGHMRCHPERHWRGIHPPPPTTTTAATSPEDHEVATCLLMLANAPQVFGGHRATHKDARGCFANSEVEGGLGHHECSVCLRVFSSGQALGGHMRCHWERMDHHQINHQQDNYDYSGITNVTNNVPRVLGLDLNSPAPPPLLLEQGDDDHASSGTKYSLDLRLGL